MKPKKQIAWKVVKIGKRTPHHHIQFRSCGVTYRQVIYEIGKWAYPPESENQFLFVFRRRKDARFFRHGYSLSYLFRIFKCEVKNLSDKKIGASGYIYCPLEFPMGTLFADAVKLIK